MPRSRSRSTSPRREERRRSRSPRRERDDDKPRRKDAGFKWKEKRKGDDSRADEGDRRLERGYREINRPRSPRREKEFEEKVTSKDDSSKKEKKERKEKKEKKPVMPAQPMIRVFVNDRLGTKAEISCYASDNIGMQPVFCPCCVDFTDSSFLGLFKRVVAAQIGRNAHEILLKRQGERPFKDQLTLEDYGVSNGVQLDLELDTGD